MEKGVHQSNDHLPLDKPILIFGCEPNINYYLPSNICYNRILNSQLQPCFKRAFTKTPHNFIYYKFLSTCRVFKSFMDFLRSFNIKAAL